MTTTNKPEYALEVLTECAIIWDNVDELPMFLNITHFELLQVNGKQLACFYVGAQLVFTTKETWEAIGTVPPIA